jgi:hypothetical protein
MLDLWCIYIVYKKLMYQKPCLRLMRISDLSKETDEWEDDEVEWDLYNFIEMKIDCIMIKI